MKVAINKCYGGFSLSTAAEAEYGQCRPDGKKRADPKLIEIIERMGKAANGACAQIKIVEVPDGVEWFIQEYDGIEWVAEMHRTWE